MDQDTGPNPNYDWRAAAHRAEAENERLREFAFGPAPEWEQANATLKQRVRELEAELAYPSSEPPTEATIPVEAYRRGGEAFWGWLREHLTVEECEAVENAGVHPDDWCAAAECCVRAARGEQDHRPFTTCPDLAVPPSEPPKACPTCGGKKRIVVDAASHVGPWIPCPDCGDVDVSPATPLGGPCFVCGEPMPTPDSGEPCWSVPGKGVAHDRCDGSGIDGGTP